MTISSSLNAGVAGLQANATRLASISDNIANSSTYGYKRVQTDFQSLVTSANGVKYSAGGVRAMTTRQVDANGSLVSTSNATDLAVRGRGMLPVAQMTEVTAGGDTNMLLTKTASFTTDSNGFLTTSSGLVLMGWPAAADGSIGTYSRDTDVGLEPVRINVNQLTGEPTTSMTLGVNLPATETEAGASGSSEQLAVEYYGNLGTSESINVTFTPTVPATGLSNEWTVQMTDSSDPATVIGEYVLTFSDARADGGTLINVATVTGGAYDPAAGTFIVTVPGGPIEIDIGVVNASTTMTQLSDTFAPINISKDGAPVGNMVTVNVDANGFVQATYDTGTTRTIYQVPLVDLPNPNGMISLDDQTYQPSLESGSFFLWNASEGPTGNIQSFAREESSTDVAEELTSMIQTQRAYSSNAKVIQTVELSLAELISLPVEIALCVSARLLLMDFRVCRATIALLFVIMLDMKHVPFLFGALRRLTSRCFGTGGCHSDRATCGQRGLYPPDRCAIRDRMHRQSALIGLNERLSRDTAVRGILFNCPRLCGSRWRIDGAFPSGTLFQMIFHRRFHALPTPPGIIRIQCRSHLTQGGKTRRHRPDSIQGTIQKQLVAFQLFFDRADHVAVPA